MARAILTVLLIMMLGMLTGCEVDSGKGQVLAKRGRGLSGAESLSVSEADIVEEMSSNRQAYRRGLVLLIEHYEQMGNNMKLEWAKSELAGIDKAPQYNYVVEASLAGSDLRASVRIHEADDIYMEALGLETKARELVVVVNENLLRMALEKYNMLIQVYPSSDKIDEAAYKAAGIYEHFQDLTVAALYYERSSDWNPDSIYSGYFKAAYILDRRLARRDEALELYKRALEREGLSRNYREFAEKRISEMTASDEGDE
jgi:tetratricopeptide (TPR) repeat protein